MKKVERGFCSPQLSFPYHVLREGEMRTLLEEIDELLSRAKYLEEKHPNTPITPDYWIRLKAVCEQARQVCPEPLKSVAPDESQKTWAEALLCLEAINEALHYSKTSVAPGDAGGV
jgi:hypothetical protein